MNSGRLRLLPLAVVGIAVTGCSSSKVSLTPSLSLVAKPQRPPFVAGGVNVDAALRSTKYGLTKEVNVTLPKVPPEDGWELHLTTEDNPAAKSGVSTTGTGPKLNISLPVEKREMGLAEIPLNGRIVRFTTFEEKLVLTDVPVRPYKKRSFAIDFKSPRLVETPSGLTMRFLTARQMQGLGPSANPDDTPELAMSFDLATVNNEARLKRPPNASFSSRPVAVALSDATANSLSSISTATIEPGRTMGVGSLQVPVSEEQYSDRTYHVSIKVPPRRGMVIPRLELTVRYRVDLDTVPFKLVIPRTP